MYPRSSKSKFARGERVWLSDGGLRYGARIVSVAKSKRPAQSHDYVILTDEGVRMPGVAESLLERRQIDIEKQFPTMIDLFSCWLSFAAVDVPCVAAFHHGEVFPIFATLAPPSYQGKIESAECLIFDFETLGAAMVVYERIEAEGCAVKLWDGQAFFTVLPGRRRRAAAQLAEPLEEEAAIPAKIEEEAP